MAGSLAAGLSLAQSVDTIVREGTEPIASEFKRVLVETRLGVSPGGRARRASADRFQSKDFAWVVMAIKIQRQVGGNLAELLDTVAATMREREYIRRQVAALAAEGKLSAWVLGGLPPLFMLYLLLTKRDYVMPMFTEPLGWVMLGGAAAAARHRRLLDEPADQGGGVSMTLLFMLGVLLVAGARHRRWSPRPSASRAAGHGPLAGRARGDDHAPEELTQDLDQPFAERVLAPLQSRALGLGRRLTGADSAERIRHKLDLAGNPPGLDRRPGRRLQGARRRSSGLVVGFGCHAVLVAGSLTTRIVVVRRRCWSSASSAPNLYLYQMAYDRSSAMQRELPDAIDLMTISVESGLGFDAAVQQVARNTEARSPTSSPGCCGRCRSARAAPTRCARWASAPTSPSCARFVSAMVQADSFGIPIAQVLRVQSSEIRVKRRQRAEEKAQQVPVKITIPLIFCILPCLFIAVMGPAASASWTTSSK